MKIEYVSDTEYTVSEISIKNIQTQKFCVFDFEATGPDEKEDQITQIGALVVDGHSGRIETKYETLVKPSKSIPEVIEYLTGIYNNDVMQAPSLPEVFQKFREFSEGAVFVTQAGYEYDWPLLINECKRNKLQMLNNKIIDTKALFSFLHPEIKEVISTNYLIDFYAISDSDIKRHNALGDSILISRIFNEILKEFKRRKFTDINIETPITIKRVQLKKL